jgi:hypothetical protein
LNQTASLRHSHQFSEDEAMSRPARIASVALLATGLFAAGIAYAADPPLHEIYQIAAAGKLEQAQTMMAQVLHDHPRSGKAHYVEAELLARQGRFASASAELIAAHRLAPGLPFVKPQSVRNLKARIDAGSTQRSSSASTTLPAIGAGAASFGGAGATPWGLVIIGLGLTALIIFAIRVLARRAGPNAMLGYGSVPVAQAGPGIGSGILGGLATGAAIGAGMVAGEAIAHHFTDSGVRGPNGAGPLLDVSDVSAYDMGGRNFGVTDGGSWDDGTALGAAGFDGGAIGDDWS